MMELPMLSANPDSGPEPSVSKVGLAATVVELD